MTELVTREDSDGLSTLTLNRPDKLNALTVGMFRELRAHVSDIARDDTLRCVVRVEAWQSKDHCLGSRLGEAANAEEAEDRARQRLLDALSVPGSTADAAAETAASVQPRPSAPAPASTSAQVPVPPGPPPPLRRRLRLSVRFELSLEKGLGLRSRLCRWERCPPPPP